jgi:hypothetical protein
VGLPWQPLWGDHAGRWRHGDGCGTGGWQFGGACVCMLSHFSLCALTQPSPRTNQPDVHPVCLCACVRVQLDALRSGLGSRPSLHYSLAHGSAELQQLLALTSALSQSVARLESNVIQVMQQVGAPASRAARPRGASAAATAGARWQIPWGTIAGTLGWLMLTAAVSFGVFYILRTHVPPVLGGAGAGAAELVLPPASPMEDSAGGGSVARRLLGRAAGRAISE